MIFQHTHEWVMNGRKTQTRRMVRPGERFFERAWLRSGREYNWSEAHVLQSHDRIKWQVGNTYAVQPGRGQKAVGRIRLTGIRREKIQAISEDDAFAEGIEAPCTGISEWGEPAEAVYEFMRLWKTVHGPGAWDANPDVWVLEFEVIDA